MSDDKYHMYGMTWDGTQTKLYVDGKLIPIRKPVRYRRLRNFLKLLLSRNLRRRLKRFQIAWSRRVWQGEWSHARFAKRVLSSDEIAKIFEMSGLSEQEKNE